MINRKNLLVIAGLILIISFAGLVFQNHQVNIKFKLIRKVGYLNANKQYKDQFCAKIEFKNKSNETIKVPPRIHYGFKGDVEPFYFEAYDLRDNEVDIRQAIDYNWPAPIDSSLIQLQNNQVICDTICSSPLFAFKSKGTFKIRIVFNSKYLYPKNDSLNDELVASNWDTIIIK